MLGSGKGKKFVKSSVMTHACKNMNTRNYVLLRSLIRVLMWVYACNFPDKVPENRHKYSIRVSKRSGLITPYSDASVCCISDMQIT